MSPSQKRLEIAMQFAMIHRPKVGGFPFLAECLRQAGITKNVWTLPSAQSMYFLGEAILIQQGKPLVEGLTEVPPFNEKELIAALRKDQAGKSTFQEFLTAAWQAGVIRYEVNFLERTVTYYGAQDESYTETYSIVKVEGLKF